MKLNPEFVQEHTRIAPYDINIIDDGVGEIEIERGKDSDGRMVTVTLSLPELEELVKAAREWMNARDAMKGTMPNNGPF